MVTAQQVPPRADVPQAARWNAESVFETIDAWQAEFEAVAADMPNLQTLPGSLTSPQAFTEAAQTLSAMRRRVMKLYFYAAMSSAVDATDMTAKQLVGQIMGLMGQLQAMAAFVNPELLALGTDTLQQWIDSGEVDDYTHLLRDVQRQAAHTASSEVESVLGMLGDPFGTQRQIAGELTNTDLRFKAAVDSDGKPFKVNQSSIRLAMVSKDREIRRTAYESYSDGYLDFKNTLAAAYITSVKQTVFNVRVRRYQSSLQAQLYTHNIPVEVFHNLIATYRANLGTWHRYWDVKRRALGVETMQPYDVWAPIVDDAPEVSYEQAVGWIANGMQPLGEDYVEAMRRGCLQERWVDYFPNEGKRQGAFSGGTYDTYPFIMMSFDDGLGGMSTLAHELGHSMHSYLSRKTQPEHYAGYSMFVAEVASNFNQALTRAYLFDAKDDPTFHITLIEEAMSNFHRYFFIMPTLAAFELEVHTRVEQGKPLTADILNGIMRDLFAEGYGDTMQFDDDREGITWAQFQHLYVPFYTFQYATGISAAHALADRVLSGDWQAAADYVKFLSLGGSVYPIDALKVAGVDMTTPEAVEKTYAVLGEYVDRLEQLTL